MELVLKRHPSSASSGLGWSVDQRGSSASWRRGGVALRAKSAPPHSVYHPGGPTGGDREQSRDREKGNMTYTDVHKYTNNGYALRLLPQTEGRGKSKNPLGIPSWFILVYNPKRLGIARVCVSE